MTASDMGVPRRSDLPPVRRAAQSEPQDLAFELHDASVVIGAAHPITDVTISVPSGACVGLVGPNGSGKSSLLNVISGYYRMTRGHLRILGVDCARRPPHKIASLGVGRSFQGIGHQESLSVRDFIAVSHEARASVGVWRSLVYSRSGRQHEQEAYADAEHLMARGGIERYAGTPMRNCPYGVRKTADLLRAYGDRPLLVLLDEPSSGLGEADRHHVMHLINDLSDELGAATLIVDHSIAFVESLCQRVVVLSGGRVLADGQKDEVLSQGDVREVLLGAEMVDVTGAGAL